MGTKLYVGNLSFKVTNDGLEELFSQFGEVRSAEVVQDRETGRSRGFGFVEMVEGAAAQAAISALHDKPHEGRPLVVNEARPREDRGPRGGGGGYGGGGGGGGGRYSPYAGGGGGGRR
jgi:RNA recognition motif-containing protein